MIYFDQAATSYPKPPEVIDKMVEFMNEIGANPGRGGHIFSRRAEEIVAETREKASQLFGCSDPNKCIFFPNATAALNQAIKGLTWKEGDHIIATSVEHNSVRRPLEFIREQFKVNVSYVKWDEDESLFLKEVERELNEKTKLIVMTHASNVTGAILPIEEVINKAKNHNVKILIDASQTAGHIPIHMENQGIDLLVFPGHKGILGPQGTGMLLVEGDTDLNPLVHGGTGVFSEEIGQPNHWPTMFESGTLNTPGIAGLLAAFNFYENRIKSKNVPRETFLTNQLLKGLIKIEGVTCFGPPFGVERMPIVAFNIENIGSQAIAMILDSHYQIAVRAGLHCSPLAHETIGTIDQGVVRASLSIFNTEEEVQKFIQAIEEIALAYN